MTALLHGLLRLLPSAFRRRFEDELREQIRLELEAARRRGRLAVLSVGLVTALDLLRTALAERWRPSFPRTGGPAGPRETTMQWTGWTRDLKQAVRGLTRARGFTTVAVVTLAVAIGANVGIFSVIDAVLLRPLPFPEPDELVYVAASAPGSDLPDEFGVAAEFYVQYAEEARTLESVALYSSFTATLQVDDRAERVRMSAPTTSLFTTLRVPPLLGRLPTPEEEDRVVLISHALWTSWFGADPGVLGRRITAAGADRTIIGVMGPEFWFPHEETLLWFPTTIEPTGITPGRFGAPMVARLAPGVTEAAVLDELGRLAQRLPDRFGGSSAYTDIIARHQPVLRPLKAELVGDASRPLWILLGAVAIVLLIACANVANLFLVRAEHHAHDRRVRRALGASRARLARAQLLEAVVVAGFAGVGAAVLAWIGIPLLVRVAPTQILRLQEAALSPATLAFTLVACVVCGLLCGVAPAVRAAQGGTDGLRDGGRTVTRRRGWGRNGLVVGQTALALVLLIGSALLVRSFQALRNVDAGYDTEDLFTFQIAPEGEYLNDGPSYARFHTDFMDRIRALPGVETVGIVENLPLNESVRQVRILTDRDATDAGGTLAGVTWAGGDYFQAMGVEVVRGRPFTEADHTTELGNAVISRTAADLLWPGEDPIGRQVRTEQTPPMTVVGVVEDVMQDSFRDEPQPLVYLPLVGPEPDAWVLGSPAYVVKTARAADIAPEIRALVREVAPGAPMYRVFTMEELARDSLLPLSFTMMTLGVVASLALLLGALGLFGVLSFVVAQRSKEIGVRMALGAEAGRVRRMVVAQGTRVVALGVLMGVLAAVGTTRFLGSLLFGVEAADLATFVGMSATMLAVGVLASWVPARRASSIDPIETLRGD